MTGDELAIFNDLIDLTIAHASMIADLRRSNTALRISYRSSIRTIFPINL
jgi:hypothetical protein